MTNDHPRRVRLPHPGWLLLAGLLLAVVVVACLIVWSRAHSTLALIGKVEQLGGSVETEPPHQRWLRNLVGKKTRAFDSVVAIRLEGTAITNADRD